MLDGMVTENISATSIIGVVGSLATSLTTATGKFGTTVESAILSGATLSAGTGEVGATEIGTGAVTAIKQAFVGIGSPTSTGSPMLWGNTFQAGSSATNAGGSIWVTFHANYLAHPYVVLQPQRAQGVTVGSITVGSFWASGTASTNFTYMAVGSM